jgi:MarR family transcriptional regulator, transcriptional regulator for hemolysin
MNLQNTRAESMVGFWINRASRAIGRRLDRDLRPLGLAMSHLPVLRALAERGPCSQRQLAEIAGVEQSTMTEMLARMERAGIVRRAPNPDDRRAVVVSLTRRAHARFAKAREVLTQGEQSVMSVLAADERVVLLKLLERVTSALESEAS